MKVTPIDIRHKEFRRAMRGYSDEEVDLFLDEVADDFEVLFKENIDLQDEVRRLKEQVAQHESLKETLQKTLISAQLQADETRANARKESELILRDAELQARNIVTESYGEKQKVQQSMAQLRQAEDDFRFKFRSLLEAHLNLLMEDEASEDRRRFRETANGTAEVAPSENAAPQPTMEVVTAEVETAPDEIEPAAAPASLPAVESAGPARSEVLADAAFASAVEEASVPAAASRPTPLTSAASAPAGAAVPTETPPAPPVSAVTVADAAAKEAPPWAASGPNGATSPVSSSGPRVAAAGSSSGVAAPALAKGSPAEALAGKDGALEQDLSVFDDFDFDFELPEEPASDLGPGPGNEGSAKKQSSVRRFLFGPKNEPGAGRGREGKDDRDFDW